MGSPFKKRGFTPPFIVETRLNRFYLECLMILSLVILNMNRSILCLLRSNPHELQSKMLSKITKIRCSKDWCPVR